MQEKFKKLDELFKEFLSIHGQCQILLESAVNKSDDISIAWLMSFPRSGTSYTLANVRDTSRLPTATNYGQDTQQLFIPVLKKDSGPYWNADRYPRPTSGFVLTKTHCAGYQFNTRQNRSQTCNQVIVGYTVAKSKNLWKEDRFICI